MASTKLYDCLIIGGGAAGLSAALALGRVQRSCALFSNDKHRNAGVQHIHAVLGADHVEPQCFYAGARRQIEKYHNTDFMTTEVTEIMRINPKDQQQQSFVAKDGQGNSWHGRSVVLATGARDILPDLEGYAENWPMNIYHCLFCEGYERRDMAKGVLCLPAFDSDPVRYTMLATRAHFLYPPPKAKDNADPSALRSIVTVFTNGPPNPNSDPVVSTALDTCAAHRVHIDTRKVTRLAADAEKEGVYVHLLNADNSQSVVHVGFLCHQPVPTVAAPHLLSQLGIECTPDGFAKAGYPSQNTNVPGVFVAGDTCTKMAHVTVAMSTGMACGAGVAQYCDTLDDQRALAKLAPQL